jgi:hypothetical protein
MERTDIFMDRRDLKALLQLSFDAGFDAGLYRGFESAGKEQSRKIPKPKAMTAKKFMELNNIG